jgi:ABC-type Fe3+-siderophore transport system permease subunit
MSSTTDSSGAPAYTGSSSPDTYQQGGTRNGLGTAALVVGIIALLTCWTVIGGIVLGILAIVLGAVGRGRAKRGEASNEGVALAGLIVGALGLALTVVLVAAGASILFRHPKQFHNLQACDKNAATSAQRQACSRQFQKSVNNN